MTASASGSSSTTRARTPRSDDGRALGAGRLGDREVRGAHRQRDREEGAPARALALGLHLAAVEVDQVLDERQAQAEPPVGPLEAGVGLPEALEDVGEELGGDALAVVADLEHDRGAHAGHAHPDVPAAGGELDGVAEQVPHHLLEPVRIADHADRLGLEPGLDDHALALGREAHHVERRPHDVGEVGGRQAKLELAGHDAAHVEDVVDDLGLRLGVALDGREGAGDGLRGRLPGAEHARPAEDGGQSGVRSSWLSVERNSSLARMASWVFSRASRSSSTSCSSADSLAALRASASS